MLIRDESTNRESTIKREIRDALYSLSLLRCSHIIDVIPNYLCRGVMKLIARIVSK